MAQGRPDFWYGQVLLLTNEPTDGDESNAPTANWAYDHTNTPDAHHDVYEQADADADIATHAADDDAHHDVYEQADADADIATHAAAADPHTGYQKESEKDQNSGYPALGASGDLLVPGDTLYLTRDGSEQMNLRERTSAEIALRITRAGATDYDAELRVGGAYKEMLTTAHTDAADPHTQYQKESEKDAASGYAALHSDGSLLTQGSYFYGVPDGSNQLYIYDRTNTETAFRFKRNGENDWSSQFRVGGAYKEVLTEVHEDAADPHPGYVLNAELTAHEGDTSTHGVTTVDGVTERDAAIATHAADDDAHHDVYEQADADADMATHEAAADPHAGYVLNAELTAHEGDTSTHGVTTVDGVTERDAAITTHAADDDAHHDVYEQADADADMATHEAAADPHAGYVLNAELTAHAADDDAHHDVYEQADADADIATHAAAADPHTGYQKESEKDQNSGYAALDAAGDLYAKGPQLHLARDGVEAVYWRERTSDEIIFYGVRDGAGDYTLWMNKDSGNKEILTTEHTDAADPHTQYQKESEKDAASGYAALHSDGSLLTQGSYFYGVPDGSNQLYIYDRTNTEIAFRFKRNGENDWSSQFRVGGAYKEVLTEVHEDAADPHPGYVLNAELTAHEADTSTHGVTTVDGVTERNAAIATHAADDDAHHDVYEQADADADIATHAADDDAHHAKYTDAEAVAAVLPAHIDRGDPNAWDFAIGDLTRDGTWNDLDLSGIADGDAVAVCLHIQLVKAADDDTIWLRKNGNTNQYNIRQLYANSEEATYYWDVEVECDSSQVIEYFIPAGDWGTLNILVTGSKI